MKNCSNECKETNEKTHGVFLEDGINTVRKNSANNGIEDFSYTHSNFLKLLEDNMKLRISVKELNNTLGDEVSSLKHTLSKLQKEHETNTELLKLQAKTHREDWQVERKEKYVAESQVQILKNQLHLLAAKFAEHEVQNSACLYNSPPTQQPAMIDHSTESLGSSHNERKHRKNKSPSKLIQKNSKCNHCTSPGSDASTSPIKNILCTSKATRPANLEQSTIKENFKEHYHKRNHGKQSSKDCQGKQTEKENSFISHSIREKSRTATNISRDNVDKCKRETPSSSSNCSESTGTKPKMVSKSSFGREKRDYIDAKKRARNILASALPVSPSSSGPSSPIQTPNRRHSSYIPITSTVLTPVSYSISPGRDKSSESISHERNDADREVSQEKCRSVNPCHVTSLVGKNSNCLEKFDEIDNNNGSNESSKTDSITMNKTPAGTVCLHLQDLGDSCSKSCQKSFCAPKVSPSDSGVSCTSITVMSGSHGTSQAASSNSSRSSSPGISLMTFALNSDGKGVPGAFYFELGTDSSKMQCPKNSCSPKPNSYVTTYNSDLSNIKSTSNEDNPLTENYHSEKILNATWVKLTGKEVKHVNSTSTMWRTARAVPSNELLNNRKNSKDIEGIKNEQNSTDDLLRNKNVEKCQKNQCIPMDQYYCTSKDLYITSPCSMKEDSQAKASSRLSVQSNKEKSDEYSDCKANLKSLASRNISSAIMSYESASKSTVSQNKISKNS